MEADFIEREIPLWDTLVNELFDSKIPNTVIWKDTKTIVDVLRFIGQHKALNHTFIPSGGGLDLLDCETHWEDGFIALVFGGQKHILKPKALHFESFGSNHPEWYYFMLETETVKPLFEETDESAIYEPVVEADEELYYEIPDWESKLYSDYPPKTTGEYNSRYRKGNFAIFSKASKYNQVSGTYDARHSKVSTESFREFIQKVVGKLDEQKAY